MEIRCLHDINVDVSRGIDIENRNFEKGEVVEVRSVTPCEPPASDMATVVLDDGWQAIICREDIETRN